ncbi:MAG: phosphoglucosamine mutase [Actinobacteria bacterium BACL2 MAG-121220-bin52]|jgi:phosphoglucosamine mutase|uniref:Phosphoglucosamine mutase n=1 Tax=Actinobacteria bacterium BACL2 MAG-121220-bin52 TaxID=1655573 RepID=A0A0R2P6V1_9ACTN|nr:MAG: phosphoglucosamine mutase [Actinobacteria bacterium BACL2 MAG-121220-bin52]MDP4615238.1 phosphoglucosamine mutase [Candidatus Nanopelagicales bacterium]HAG54040.1 phosphoglucosamine mutase [Actinomycetota bacterium]
MALFGTDGVRGVAGVDLTAELAFNLSTAAASVLADLGEFAGHRPTAIVGQDSRASGQYLEEAICRGLSSAGIDVYRVGILPTPAISFLVKDRGADLGVMISASHNPASDNGIKFFDRTGSKLADQIEAKIESVLGQAVESSNGAGSVIEDLGAKESYIQNLLKSLDGNLSGLKVVVDCANGAASFVAPELLKRAGAEVIAISASPNGLNINDSCGSTHLENLIEAVKGEGADIGIAHDGDADRVLAIDDKGSVIDGDFILGILAQDMELPTKTVVGTVMTNLGLIKALEEKGIGFIATAVGDRYVLEEMLAGGHLLGGEQSGHIIMSKYANTGDGLLTALQLISKLKKSGKSASELASFMKRYPQVLINVSGVAKEKLASNQVIAKAVGDAKQRLADKGRVLLRASGTEALIRVMIEAQDLSLAQELASELATLVKSELSL